MIIIYPRLCELLNLSSILYYKNPYRYKVEEVAFLLSKYDFCISAIINYSLRLFHLAVTDLFKVWTIIEILFIASHFCVLKSYKDWVTIAGGSNHSSNINGELVTQALEPCLVYSRLLHCSWVTSDSSPVSASDGSLLSEETQTPLCSPSSHSSLMSSYEADHRTILSWYNYQLPAT